MSTVEIAAKDVKALRDRTGAGMMDCKKALTEAEGDLEKAIEILRVRQGKKIQDLGERAATEGTVQSYIHAGSKVGVLIEVDCNTDFVAKNDDFVSFAREVAMQIAATPTVKFVSREEVPEELKEAESRIYEQEAADKPENIREKIVSGKLDSWLSTIVLLEQEMHNPKFDGKTVQQLRDELTATTGENVVIRRFVRFGDRPVGRSAARRLRRRGRGSGTLLSAPMAPVFKRILLKLSGEALMGDLDYGTDPERLSAVARQVADVRDQGVEVAIVVGAGNIYRGMKGAAAGMDRSTADYMGMLATLLNALPLQDALEKIGIDTRVQSALGVSEVAEPYIRRRAMSHLEKGRVVIFAAGTGNPFFTTDTAAALRAAEIHAEIILMAKNGVEGVYTADPAIDPEAKFIPEITHMEAIERRLRVMDSTALALCMENAMPINVFNMDDDTSLARIISGVRVGTLVIDGYGRYRWRLRTSSTNS